MCNLHYLALSLAEMEKKCVINHQTVNKCLGEVYKDTTAVSSGYMQNSTMVLLLVLQQVSLIR